MKIIVLAGGVSTERNVSLISGKQVYQALKSRGHQVVLLDVFMGYMGETEGIFEQDKDWAEDIPPISEMTPDLEAVKARRREMLPSAERERYVHVLFGPNVIALCKMADIVFMALHGDCGENGKIQAAFDLHGIKYTGTDSFSSALAMDKAVTKQLFTVNGVKTPPYRIVKKGEEASFEPEFPCVVKVTNGGSSVGVYIVKDRAEYDAALSEAFTYDHKILIEAYIKGREFTDCVIEGQALPIVEIAPKSGFYDYKNKYQAGTTVETCPAEIDEELAERIRTSAVRAYQALELKTYARMDFMVDDSGEVYCLEANTLPGMTPTSLVPQEAAAVGRSFEDLCEWIIDISLNKYQMGFYRAGGV
ncbi:MAG: D-alanine--D-alanine ligase [Lachnospiraceae bacterium]|nr:D-alanine--D-alanine ligase [Lachnospiraceae bacterium]